MQARRSRPALDQRLQQRAGAAADVEQLTILSRPRVLGGQPRRECVVELDQDAAVARANFSRSNLLNKIILHTGNALTIIPTLEESWDLVFIDADKTSYIDYYKMVLPRLKPGGIILADNVLFHGQVLEQPLTGKNAKAIQEFNEYVDQDKSVEKVLLTVRDGLLLIRKNG